MRVFNCFRALGLFCLLCMGGNALAGPIKGDHALSFSAGITGTMGDNFVFLMPANTIPQRLFISILPRNL